MTIKLDVSPFGTITDTQFYDFCVRHGELRIERTAKGEVEVLPPTGGEAGRQNFELGLELGAWVKVHRELGLAFDSSTGFRLPNGAIRAPDLAWVSLERWRVLTPQQRRHFPPLCPDFVIELLSTTDQLANLRGKMEEYIANGLRLGWLIDPFSKTVEVYQQQLPTRLLKAPKVLEGDPVLPGLRLDLTRIFY